MLINRQNTLGKKLIANTILATLVLFHGGIPVVHAAAIPTAPSLQVLAGTQNHHTAVVGAYDVIVGRFTVTANVDAELERFDVGLQGDDDGVVGFGQTSGDLEPATVFRSCRLLSRGIVIAPSEVPEVGTIGYLRFHPTVSLQALVPKQLEVTCDLFNVPVVSGNPDAYFAAIFAPGDISATNGPGSYIQSQNIYLGRHHVGANAFGDTVSTQVIERGNLLSGVAPSSPAGSSVARGDSHVHVATFGFMAEHEDFVIDSLQIDHLVPSRSLGTIQLEYTNCYGNVVTSSIRPSHPNTSQFSQLEVCVIEGRPSLIRVYADITQTALLGDTLTFGLATAPLGTFTAHGLVSQTTIQRIDNQQVQTLWGERFIVTQ